MNEDLLLLTYAYCQYLLVICLVQNSLEDGDCIPHEMQCLSLQHFYSRSNKDMYLVLALSWYKLCQNG